jgi:hypothetical protein
VGDRVIARRNDRDYDVDSGTRGTVRAVDPDRLGVTIHTDDGWLRELPAGYVAEHLEHAYALTVHGSQGATVERAQAIGTPEDFINEWAYTALSRARDPVTVQLIAQPTDRSQRAWRLDRLVDVDHRERGHWFDRHGDELIEFPPPSSSSTTATIRPASAALTTSAATNPPGSPTGSDAGPTSRPHPRTGTAPSPTSTTTAKRSGLSPPSRHPSCATTASATPGSKLAAAPPRPSTSIPSRQFSAHRPSSTATSADDETRSCLQPSATTSGRGPGESSGAPWRSLSPAKQLRHVETRDARASSRLSHKGVGCRGEREGGGVRRCDRRSWWGGLWPCGGRFRPPWRRAGGGGPW